MPYKDKLKQKAAQNLHYLKNKDNYGDSRRKNRKQRKEWFRELKSNLQCAKCGCKDSRCLDFHHRDEKDKSFTICEAVKQGYSEEKILLEILKCDVVCANCHAKLHYKEKENPRERVGKNVKWVKEFKGKVKCRDCDESNPCVLDFHHVGVKKGRKGTVSRMVNHGCSVNSLLEEITQCEVVCKNCHRIEHDGNVWK